MKLLKGLDKLRVEVLEPRTLLTVHDDVNRFFMIEADLVRFFVKVVHRSRPVDELRKSRSQLKVAT